MASKEVKGEPPQMLNYKTWVLRVSVHCEGCKKKVKKLLSQVPGVQTVDIDIRQQRAIVIGNVEADTLIKKLIKSGKNAELWPEQPMQKEKKTHGKYEHRDKQSEHHHQESQRNQEIAQVKIQQPSGQKKEVDPPAVKIDAFKKTPTKKSEEIDDFDVNIELKSKENDGGCDAAIKAGEINFKISGVDHEEKDQSKSEGKQVEGPPPEAEKHGDESDNNRDREKSAGSGGGESGDNVIKKKSEGQSGNSTSKVAGPTPSSSVDKPADKESGNHHSGGQPISLMSANENPPRHYHYHGNHGSHHYGPLPSPSYGVSYNTSNPTSSHTTLHYAPSPPPSAYIYSYPGPEVHPPPSGTDLYPSQPLDSFEMFSDENPNGCLVM